MLKVKIFAASSRKKLEDDMNQWLSQETEGFTIEIAAIEYSTTPVDHTVAYSALIFYEEKESNEQTS